MLNVDGRHTSVVHFRHHFDYDHLPQHLAEVSAIFHDAAQRTVDAVPDSPDLSASLPDLSASLRSLWEAKNAAVLVAVAASREVQDG